MLEAGILPDSHLWSQSHCTTDLCVFSVAVVDARCLPVLFSTYIFLQLSSSCTVAMIKTQPSNCWNGHSYKCSRTIHITSPQPAMLAILVILGNSCSQTYSLTARWVILHTCVNICSQHCFLTAGWVILHICVNSCSQHCSLTAGWVILHTCLNSCSQHCSLTAGWVIILAWIVAHNIAL